MSHYRRLYLEGGTYFFTVVTHRRRPLFNDVANVNTLRDAIRHVRADRAFDLAAIVVLPDHLHCIWQFDGPDTDYSTRWQMIKARFTRTSPQLKKPVWQPRFWEHAMRHEEDLRKHLDYIHCNPVKHGYAKTPLAWRCSSFHEFVRKGWYAPDWGADAEVQSIRNLDFE